jgi:hypothetical protein
MKSHLSIWKKKKNQEISEFKKTLSELTYRMYKLCKLLLVCTFENHYDENIWSSMSEKKRKNQQGKKGQKYDYFVHILTPLF